MPNLIPGGKNLINWTPVNGGLNIIPNFSPSGFPAFTMAGPIGVDINNAMNSQSFNVIAGGIYSVKTYIDATFISAGPHYAGFNLIDAVTSFNFGGNRFRQGAKGYFSAQVTIPAGYNAAVMQLNLQNAMLDAGTVQWSEPDVELVGFQVNVTEASFSPIPFLSYWIQGSVNGSRGIPCFSDGEYLYIPFVGGSGLTTYEWYGVIKINSTGWCAFVSNNTPNFTSASYTGGYGITFDGGKTFTFNNGNFFARFTVPDTFQAGRIFRFAFAGTAPPANACGGTGYFSAIYSAGGKTILEYVQNFALDSHIWAQVLETGLSADLGFVDTGQPDPLFNPQISGSTQTALFPNPPLTYNSGGFNISFAQSQNYGGAYSVMQSYQAELNASDSGGCTLNKITISVSTQGIVDCLDITGGSFESFGIFAMPGLFAAFSVLDGVRLVMTADFSRFYYYSSTVPGGYNGAGIGILNGELFNFVNLNNGPIHVFTGTVPAFPAASKIVTRNALVLTNSTRPVSPLGAFKT